MPACQQFLADFACAGDEQRRFTGIIQQEHLDVIIIELIANQVNRLGEKLLHLQKVGDFLPGLRTGAEQIGRPAGLCGRVLRRTDEEAHRHAQDDQRRNLNRDAAPFLSRLQPIDTNNLGDLEEKPSKNNQVYGNKQQQTWMRGGCDQAHHPQ
jgi:hypothetical protein